MTRVIRNRLSVSRDEDGFTLIELLVASMIGVIVMGGVATLVITAVKDQPKLSARAQLISDARVVMERLTHEIRNGVKVDPERASASEVSFLTYLRRKTCGELSAPAATSPAIQCQVTYRCTTTECTRIEAAPGVFEGTERPIVTGIDSAEVFTYKPKAEDASFVGITLNMPSPDGNGTVIVSDGAALRNATLAD